MTPYSAQPDTKAGRRREQCADNQATREKVQSVFAEGYTPHISNAVRIGYPGRWVLQARVPDWLKL